MGKLVKANVARLLKDQFLYVCFVIAVVMTYIVTKADMELATLHGLTQNDCMVVVSGAIFGFLAVFVPVFEGVEYGNGVIRNKIIMGHSQKDVYFAHLIANIVIIVAVELLWLVTGVVSGADFNLELLTYAVSMFFSNLAFASIVTCLLMRTQNTVVTVIVSALLFYVSFMSCLITNYIVSHGSGVIKKISIVLENINPVGQWFTHTLMCNDHYAPAGGELISFGIMPQIMIAVLIIAGFTAIGIFKIEDRNLK